MTNTVSRAIPTDQFLGSVVKFVLGFDGKIEFEEQEAVKMNWGDWLPNLHKYVSILLCHLFQRIIKSNTCSYGRGWENTKWRISTAAAALFRTPFLSAEIGGTWSFITQIMRNRTDNHLFRRNPKCFRNWNSSFNICIYAWLYSTRGGISYTSPLKALHKLNFIKRFFTGHPKKFE